MLEVNINHLQFAYDKELVLEDVNLHADPGDFICLLGQSGCGKSTLLRLLAGLEKSDPEQLQVNGKPVTAPSLERTMVFQDYGLFPWMSASDNIDIALRQKFKDWNKEQRKECILTWMGKIGLDESLYNKLPLELSGGQRQRFAVARAFALDAPLMLMDEPFGALDAVTAALLQDTVLDLWNQEGSQRKTVFFVTHSVDEAMLLASKIVVLGQSPSKVIYTYSFEGKTKPNRHDMFTDPEMMDLRNTLFRIINDEIQQKAEAAERERAARNQSK